MKYLDQVKRIALDFIVEGIEILNEFEINYKLSSNHKIHTEIGLIKLCSINKKKTLIQKNENKVQFEKEEKKVEEEKKVDNSLNKDESKPKETPNLKNLFKKQKVNKIEEAKEIISEKIDFSAEGFNKVIEELIISLKEKKSEVAILKKKKTIEKHSVIFHLENELEGTIFENLENRLNRKLKSVFVENIDVKKEVAPKEKEKTIYTNKDKFEYLSKKNSSLKELKNKLGLDYEF